MSIRVLRAPSTACMVRPGCMDHGLLKAHATIIPCQDVRLRWIVVVVMQGVALVSPCPGMEHNMVGWAAATAFRAPAPAAHNQSAGAPGMDQQAAWSQLFRVGPTDAAGNRSASMVQSADAALPSAAGSTGSAQGASGPAPGLIGLGRLQRVRAAGLGSRRGSTWGGGLSAAAGKASNGPNGELAVSRDAAAAASMVQSAAALLPARAAAPASTPVASAPSAASAADPAAAGAVTDSSSASSGTLLDALRSQPGGRQGYLLQPTTSSDLPDARARGLGLGLGGEDPGADSLFDDGGADGPDDGEAAGGGVPQLFESVYTLRGPGAGSADGAGPAARPGSHEGVGGEEGAGALRQASRMRMQMVQWSMLDGTPGGSVQSALQPPDPVPGQ